MIDTLVLTIKDIDINKYKEFIFNNQLENEYKLTTKNNTFEYSMPIYFQGDTDNVVYISFNNTLNSLKIQTNYSKLLYNTQLKNVYYLEIDRYIDTVYNTIKKYIPIERTEIETSNIYRVDFPINMNVTDKVYFYTSLMNNNTLQKESYYKKINYSDTISFSTRNLRIQFYDKLQELTSKTKNKSETMNEIMNYKENILRLEFQNKFKDKDKIKLNELQSIVYEIIDKNYEILLEKILYRLNKPTNNTKGIYQMSKEIKKSNTQILWIVLQKFIQNPDNSNDVEELLQVIKETSTRQTFYKYKTKIKKLLTSKELKGKTHCTELLQLLNSERMKYKTMRLHKENTQIKNVI